MLRRTFWKAMHAGGAPRVLHGAHSLLAAIKVNSLSNLFTTLALMRRPSQRRHAHVAHDLDQRRRASVIRGRRTMQCDATPILQRVLTGMRQSSSAAASACHARDHLPKWRRRGRSAVCTQLIACSDVIWLRGREVIMPVRSSLPYSVPLSPPPPNPPGNRGRGRGIDAA